MKPTCRINFNIKQPQEFLKKHGFVYTIKFKRKYNGLCRIKFNNKDVAIGYVEEVGNLKDIDLQKYVKYSGFKSLHEWLNVAYSLYAHHAKHYLYLYKVEVIGWLK